MAFCIIRGLMLGLLNSISSIIAIVAGIFLSKRYYLVFSEFLKKIAFPDIHGIVSYILIFLIFFIVIKFFFILAKQITSSSGLTTFDKMLGVSLGFAKGILICSIIITVIQVTMPPKSNMIVKSILLPYYNKAISTTGFIPADFTKYFKKI